MTGMTVFSVELEAKRFEMLHELIPETRLIGILIDPKTQSGAEAQAQAVEAAARKLGREISILHASTETELDKAFETFAELRAGGVVITGGPFFLNRREQVLALAARYSLPAIYENREFTVAGGLMSYGTNVPDVYRQLGVYAGRILKGERPAELPFLQPTKFDIAINLKTAKAIGLDVPTSILLRANEVIE